MEDATGTETLPVEDHASISDELLVRRMKNRERQRRYRARKRLEAETRNANFLNHETLHLEGHSHECRIQCFRDWKKDAREAHVNLEPAGNSQYDSVFPVVPASEVGSVHRVCHRGGRDWKAAARNRMESANPDNSSGTSKPIEP